MPRVREKDRPRDRDRDRDRGGRDGRGGGRKQRRKVCQFCEEKTAWVDYKDVQTLRKFISDRGKIRARRVTGTCTQHQGHVASAIKVAREMGLLPYAAR